MNEYQISQFLYHVIFWTSNLYKYDVINQNHEVIKLGRRNRK